jgi:dihydrolipoamide dehydrogenase
MTTHYDVLILGGGPGGYPAAIKLAQGKKKVAIIEGMALGGTCLNRGCIPTKTLLSAAKEIFSIEKAKGFGITREKVSLDFSVAAKKRDEVVAKLGKSLEGLIKSYKIDVINGFGTFLGPNCIEVGGTKYEAPTIIIATGSEPKLIPAFPFDDRLIHSSTSILKLEKVPKSIAIIGGGAIGCEFASIFRAWGTKVSLIEALDRIIPLESPTLSTFLTREFQKQGIEIFTKCPVEAIATGQNSVSVAIPGKTIDADMALVAIGRTLNSGAIGLEKAGVAVDRGAILINEWMQTSAPHIYAVGDITAKAPYAHAATHQGLLAAQHILGNPTPMNYDAIPSVIFCLPEIASCGMSLDEATKRGFRAKRASYPMSALGKAQASLETEGFVALIYDEATGQILGAEAAGGDAANLIATASVAITNELTVECLAETIFAHPTLQEAWMEAARIAAQSPLHMPRL